MSTSQRQVDTSLGELAATAAVTGCPLEQVQRMCEASEFTRGLEPGVLTGAITGLADGVLHQTDTMSGMVAEVAEVATGLGEGVPGQEMCAAGEALSSHAGQLVDAVTSIGSCAGAVDALTTGCAEVIGSLATDVCGLVEFALHCGAGEVAGTVAHEAVSAITGILEQRNCGLENLMDTTLGVCAAAADIPLGGCAAVSADVTVSADLAVAAEVEVALGVAGEGAGDVTMGSATDTAVAAVESTAVEEPIEQNGSVDPLHGIDKSDLASVGSTSVEVAADAGDTAVVEGVENTEGVGGAAGIAGVEDAGGIEAFAGAGGEGVEDGMESGAPAEDVGGELGGDQATESGALASSGDGWDPDIWTTSDPR